MDDLRHSQCPVCGKRFIPAPLHVFKINKKYICTYTCMLKAERFGVGAEQTSKESKPIVMFDINNRFIREYHSSKEAASALFISAESIRKCCRGQTSNAGGFVFRYKNQNETEEEAK